MRLNKKQRVAIPQLSLAGVGFEWIYEPDPDHPETVRYTLGIKKGEGNTVFCTGINPSYAVIGTLDPTLKNVDRFAGSNGFSTWFMLNVYPQRATDPNNLHRDMDPLLHTRNMERIDALLSAYKNPVIWAAWGTLIKKRPYLKDCLLDIAKVINRHNGVSWVALGKESVDGHPHHPLFLKKTEKFWEFDIMQYLHKLGSSNL